MTRARFIVYGDDNLPIVTDLEVQTEEQTITITIGPHEVGIQSAGPAPVLKVTPAVGQNVYIDRGDSVGDSEVFGPVQSVRYAENGDCIVTIFDQEHNLGEVPHWEVMA